MAYAIIIGAAFFVFFDYAATPLEQAVNAFLLAGIIPGTSIQVPWYVTLVSTPLLLYGLYRLLSSLLAKDLARRAAKNTETKKSAGAKQRLTQAQA